MNGQLERLETGNNVLTTVGAVAIVAMESAACSSLLRFGKVKEGGRL
jgi:hypothetical protein